MLRFPVNLSPGPAALPWEVMQRLSESLVHWNGQAISPAEISHREEKFLDIYASLQNNFRKLLHVPEEYEIVFLSGGATTVAHFLPYNFAFDGVQNIATDYLVTGSWSHKAFVMGEQFGSATQKGPGKDAIAFADWQGVQDSDNVAYVHYCPNETISGLEIFDLPTQKKPLVADMSSTLCSRPISVADFEVIYACAQKNFGLAGLTLLVCRKSWLQKPIAPKVPETFQFSLQAKLQSMRNTPDTFAWYSSLQYTNWMLEQGGLQEMEKRNRRKAEILYACIDSHAIYSTRIARANRSLTNVTFAIADATIEKAFVEKVKAANIVGIKGHREVGGFRASIYNGITVEQVEYVVDCMNTFARHYG